MKGQCKKVFAIHLRPYIPILRFWLGVFCIYEIMIAFKFSCKISHIQDTVQKIYRIYLRSHHFTLSIIFMCACSLYSCAHAVYIHVRMQSIFIRNIKTREVLGSWFIGYLKLFSVSTINSMCTVLYSVTMRERLKTRKSPAINYWQDTISLLKRNRNVRNINNLWEILTSFVILYYFSL